MAVSVFRNIQSCSSHARYSLTTTVNCTSVSISDSLFKSWLRDPNTYNILLNVWVFGLFLPWIKEFAAYNQLHRIGVSQHFIEHVTFLRYVPFIAAKTRQTGTGWEETCHVLASQVTGWQWRGGRWGWEVPRARRCFVWEWVQGCAAIPAGEGVAW